MVIHYRVGIGDLLQPATRIALGPARSAARTLPQRFRRGLLAEPVTGRRLGRVARVGSDLPLQLRDHRGELLVRGRQRLIGDHKINLPDHRHPPARHHRRPWGIQNSHQPQAAFH